MKISEISIFENTQSFPCTSNFLSVLNFFIFGFNNYLFVFHIKDLSSFSGYTPWAM